MGDNKSGPSFILPWERSAHAKDRVHVIQITCAVWSHDNTRDSDHVRCLVTDLRKKTRNLFFFVPCISFAWSTFLFLLLAIDGLELPGS